jgi:hypothetical protein
LTCTREAHLVFSLPWWHHTKMSGSSGSSSGGNNNGDLHLMNIAES